MATAYLAVANRAHAESLTGSKEGDIVFNRELNAKMVYRSGAWVTFTGGNTVANKLSGYVFCLTGKMWTTREEVERAIHAEGGSVSRSMARNSILVQGTVAGEGKSKKQRVAEANGQKILDSDELNTFLQGRTSASVIDLLGTSSKKKKSPPVKAKPIDRDRHNATVKQVFEDIEAIAFK